MADPDWLLWTREMQALAQTGLAFTRDPYDRERYERLRALAAEIMAAHTATPAEHIAGLFAGQHGYATPKIDVRTAVFDSDDRVLLVRETVDGDRWTLPGGWADVNHTPAESAAKEVAEETGYRAEIVKLAAVWDRTRQAHPAGPFSCAKLFFIARLAGGAPATSLETSGCEWFAEAGLPGELSFGRVLPGQLRRMFAHWRDPALPTEFE